MNGLNDIKQIQNVEVYENVDLSKYTTIKLSNYGSIVIVKSEAALREIINLFNSINQKYHIVGWGANQVLVNTANTIFLKLKFEVNEKELDGFKQTYRLPSSISLNVLTAHAQKYELKGWEVFTGVPATLGGAVAMNAGTSLGEIGSLIQEVKIIDRDGKIKILTKIDLNFSYRTNKFLNEGDIIVEVVIGHLGQEAGIKEKIKDYLEYRKKTQPLNMFNCGCIFKNNSSQLQAGKIIDLLGLKGLMVGDMQISHKHANFFNNTNAAKTSDFNNLVDIVQEEVFLFTGIKFELEVKIY